IRFESQGVQPGTCCPWHVEWQLSITVSARFDLDRTNVTDISVATRTGVPEPEGNLLQYTGAIVVRSKQLCHPATFHRRWVNAQRERQTSAVVSSHRERGCGSAGVSGSIGRSDRDCMRADPNHRAGGGT